MALVHDVSHRPGSWVLFGRSGSARVHCTDEIYVTAARSNSGDRFGVWTGVVDVRRRDPCRYERFADRDPLQTANRRDSGSAAGHATCDHPFTAEDAAGALRLAALYRGSAF